MASSARLLRLADVANALGVSVRTVRRLIVDGELRATNVGAGSAPQWRVSEDEVRRFIARRSRRPRS